MGTSGCHHHHGRPNQSTATGIFAQILDSVPGPVYQQRPKLWLLGIRGFNRPGDYTSRVLLLVDNHRLNDAVYDQGGAGTEMPIDVDLIDRVEIIKGPGSALYGTNAFSAWSM